MTIHFAAARKGATSPLTRALAHREPGQPANDNSAAIVSDTLLHEALHHFAACGLGAARQARNEAESAFFSGNREAYDRWLEICRILDRRMAGQVLRETERSESET